MNLSLLMSNYIKTKITLHPRPYINTFSQLAFCSQQKSSDFAFYSKQIISCEPALREPGRRVWKNAILELLTKRYPHKRHKQYLEIEAPGAMFEIKKVVAKATEHFL